MRAAEFRGGEPAVRLLALVLMVGASLAADASSVAASGSSTNLPAAPARSGPLSPAAAAQTSSVPLKPTPVPARRDAWPVALTKAVPSSIADLKSIEQRVESLVARVSPAVVAIEVGYGTGSGVVISADGLVLTAGHLCGRPNREVRFTFSSGRVAHGKTLGADLDSDTGLMKITSSGSWPHAAVGDLNEARIGDWVLALGHPGGFDPRRSLVVRLGRVIRIAPAALQTDCTISPGDSGGPLLDMEGRVIAIHSAITDSMAENFHVPVTQYYEDWDVLAKGAVPEDPAPPPVAYVGATSVDEKDGCRLTGIDRNSPAFKAGLKVGDLVLKVEGRDIKAAASFRRWVAESEPGETLNLQVKRGDQVLSLDVKLERLPRRK